MLLKRLISTTAAFALAVSFALTTVSADSESTVTFKANKKMLSSASEPTLSFDEETFMSYIHLTRDAEKAGISFKQDIDTYYQGASLSVSADTKGVKGYMTFSCMVRDDDNNLVYPDAPDPKTDDTSTYSMIGIELQSSDFGLSCFDGCLISFAYRLTQDDESALLDKSVWVFPSNDDYQGLANNPTKLTVDTAIDDNVSQYRKNVISVPTDVGATKLVFEIPTIGAISGDVLYLDNIQIEVPDGYSDDAPYVANVDGYNSRAEARETIDEIKITKNQAVTTDSTEEVEKSSDKTKPLIIVLSVVVAAAVIVFLVIFIKKRRNRFY